MQESEVGMSREQIEEIGKILLIDCEGACTECEYYERFDGSLCIPMRLANELYKQGYRKQSEPISCGHEKGGEWVQLPCKVGDILYVISQMKDKRILPFINEYEVTSISIKKKSIVIYHEMDGYIKSFKQTDFGRTIFLTKEEAERAMTDINVGSK
jgi:hypothetical protein